jgi:putative Holliday junction resolvase
VTPERGRVLSLDLGEVRVGLALSDELRITAQPAGVLVRVGSRSMLREIANLVAEHGVSAVVVGYPLHLSGEEGERARDAREIARRLRESLAVPVELWDERMSTAEAERTLIAGGVRRERRRKVVDSIAAVLILQSWLAAHSEDGLQSEG